VGTPHMSRNRPCSNSQLFLHNKIVTSFSVLKFWAFFFANFEEGEVFETRKLTKVRLDYFGDIFD
jgi:hypothetical protein